MTIPTIGTQTNLAPVLLPEATRVQEHQVYGFWEGKSAWLFCGYGHVIHFRFSKNALFEKG